MTIANSMNDQGGYRSVDDIVTKDGERRRTTWYDRVVTDDDGEIITILSQFEDVTGKHER
jgi:PAS domain-containing protein